MVVRGEGVRGNPWRRFIVFCLPLVGAAPAESAGNDKGRLNSLSRRLHAATQSVSAAAYTPAGLYPNTIFHFLCTPLHFTTCVTPFRVQLSWKNVMSFRRSSVLQANVPLQLFIALQPVMINFLSCTLDRCDAFLLSPPRTPARLPLRSCSRNKQRPLCQS